MANPYYVDPFGGVNVGQQYGQALTGIGQALGQRRELAQQKQKQDEAISAISEAVKSGDNNAIADTMLKYPEYSQLISNQVGFRSDATKQNMIEGMRGILSNPENTEQILTDRIQMVEAAGGDASDTRRDLELYRQNPEQYKQVVERSYAMIDPEGFKSYQNTLPGGKTKPTANIQDFEYYTQLKASDPQGAAMFAKSVGLIEEPKDIKQTTAMQNFDKWQAMPDGPEKDAFSQLVGISPKKTAAQVQKEVEKAANLESDITSINNTVQIGEDLLNHPGFDSYFGFSSIFPTRPGSDTANFEVALDSFRNNLTLDNLSKMSGVLTDKDIAVLSSAAAAIDKGMSETAARAELKKIFARLKGQAKTKQKELGKLSKPTKDQTTPASQPKQQLTDDQLLSKYLD